MLKNVQKIVNSKTFLISLLIILMMFTSVGLDMKEAYAIDVDDANEMELDLNVEDNLKDSQEDEMPFNIYSLNGGTFEEIQNVVNIAHNGDQIELNGEYGANGENVSVVINKKLIITSPSQATLDGENLTNIFKIYEKGSQSSFSNLKFINGFTEDKGGAIRINARNITIDNCVFENNHASSGSGAVYTSYLPNVAEGLTISNCNFTNNVAGNSAGALGAFGQHFKIINCIFDSNSVYADKACYGGAIQVGLDTNVSYGVVVNSTFISNKAVSSRSSSHGGAGCVRNGSSYYNCIFINNSADLGGALTYHASGNLNNCTLINNTAKRYGGAVAILLRQDFMDLNITNSRFIGNQAPLGGAVKLDGFNIKIENSTFEDNYASELGGAVNIEAFDVSIINSDFERNIANIDGGAVYIKGNNTEIRDSKFIANEAIPDVKKLNDGLGGAIYVNSTRALAQNNIFKLNTARNGSALYFDKYGVEFKLINNTLYQNQAWVYALPIQARDIYYGETETIKSVIYGGNNIADYDNLAVSNAIYNAADYDRIEIDGEHPVSGATNSGKLYQDDREYNMAILMTVKYEDDTVVYNRSLNSSYLGEVSFKLKNLKPGKYYVTAKHYEDNYYKEITNATTFNVIPKTDNKISKSVNKKNIAYGDVVVWTLNVTNDGPNNATGVVIHDALPEGLVWQKDNTNGKYNPKTGVLNVGSLNVGEIVIVKITTLVNKTGKITNNASVEGKELDTNMSNNHDEVQINVPRAADLKVTKKVNNSNPNFGDLICWSVVVFNNGPDVAHDVEVLDVLPNSLVFVNASGNYDVKTGTWLIKSLGAGKSVKLTLVSRVNRTGEINNGVFVSANEFDRNLSNNFDDEIIDVSPACDLKVTKLANDSNPNLGDLVSWSVVVLNNGPDFAHNIKVSDILPKSLVFVNASGYYDIRNSRWLINSLGVGKSVKLTLVTRVNRTGEIKNVVSVSADEFDWNLSNNVDDEVIDVSPACDLRVTKLVNDSNPNFDDLVSWSVVVLNNGPDVAHDIKVRDILPESLVFVNATGYYNVKTGSWLVSSLGVGKSVKLTLVSRVNRTGEIKNVVSVSADEFDWNLSNNVDDEVIDVGSACDLRVTKFVNDSNPNFDDLVSWSVVVLNNGPDVAHDIKVRDILPESLVFVNATGYYNVKTGSWLIKSLDVGKSVKLTLVSKVNKTGAIKNSVSVSSNEFDPDMSNNHDEVEIDVPKAADLKVTKKVNNSNPNFGDLVNWDIVVLNNGPDVAHNVLLRDVLPESLVFVNASGNYDVKTGSWFIKSLGDGKSVRLNLVSRVNKTGEIRNSVNVTSKEYDWNLSNNFDDEFINVAPACDLVVVKLVNDSNPNFGDLITWTVVVLNNGPNAAHNVKVQDILPESLVFVNAGEKYDAKTESWFISSLDVGKSVVLTIVSKVNKTGEITNAVNVTADEFDWDLSNNFDDEFINVAPACDLVVVKLVNDSNPNFGDLITWSVVVLNNGPDVAHDIEVKDILPESLVFVNATGNYDKQTGTWLVKSLGIGQSAQLDIVSLVNATGNITNAASASSDEYDYNMTNNNASNTISVNKSGDLSIVKTVNASEVNYGDLIKWIIVVSNNGPDKVTDVIAEDMIPEGLILINYTSSKGFYDEGMWNVCCLDKGQSQTLELICKVNKTGNITNVARIFGKEHDSNWTNNEDNETILIPPAADISVTKQADNDSPFFGEMITWMIKVQNNGPDQATDIRIIDYLDENLIFHSYESTNGVYREGIWSISQLNNGDCEYLNISCYVNGLGVIENDVSASVSEFDIDMSNNQAESFIEASPVSDLTIQKMANDSTANYGELVKWTLMVSNEGLNDATGVIVEDALPDSLEYVESDGDGEYVDGIWQVGNLKVGENRTLDIVCKVVKTGNIVNSAVVYGNEKDPDLSDNEVEESISVPPAADLSVSKTVSKHEYAVGDLIEYSIRIINNGPDDALNVKVNELFDSSLVLKSFKASKGSYDVSKNEWYIEELVSGGEETLLMEFEAVHEGIFENIVFVSSSAYDADMSNNEDSAFVKVVQNATNKTDMNYTVTKSQVVENNSAESKDTGSAISNLQKHSTANPVMSLVVSLLFSIVFVSGDILKKRLF